MLETAFSAMTSMHWQGQSLWIPMKWLSPRRLGRVIFQALKFPNYRLAWALVICLGVMVIPVWGQSLDREAVALDGVELFEVASTEEITARERADYISRELTALARGSEPVQVRVETRNNVPVIVANDRYVMSVTENDAQIGGQASARQQADRWQTKIQTALDTAIQARQKTVLIANFLKGAAVLLVAGVVNWFLGWLWRKRVRPTLESMTLSIPGTDQPEHPPTNPFMRPVTYLTRWAFSRQGENPPLLSLNFFLRATLFLLRTVLWGGAILYVLTLFPLTRSISYLVYNALRDGLLSQSLQLGSRSYSLVDLLVLLSMLLVLIIVANAVTNLLRSRVLHITGMNRGSQEALAVLAKYTLIFLGTVVLLQIWGLDLSSLALLASALGVGIGLGLQNIAKDFVSGLIMVFERPVQVGDFIDVGDFMGTVERIGARSTEIRTLDHISIIMPNSRFLEEAVINWSHGNPVSRIQVPVGVAYGSDPQKLKASLLEVCQQNQQVLQAPAPQVFFLGFGDSALEFSLIVWITQPSRQFVIKSDLYFAIEASLRQHGIEIPFPQRDLHIRSGQLPLELSPEALQWLSQFSNGGNPGEE